MEVSPALFAFANFLWSAAAASAFYAIFKLIRWRQHTFNYFKRLGIPGPRPNILCGNLIEYHGKGFVHALTDWCSKYGDVFGFYNGDAPMLVVKDADFMTYVFVKNFQNFTNRGVLLHTDQEHSFQSMGVLHTKGEQWKRIRGCISQAFTDNKLKQMAPQIAQSTDTFMKVLAETADAGDEYPVFGLFQGLAMDYMCHAGFGFDCCFRRDLKHPFLEGGRRVLHGFMNGFFHMFAHSTTTLGPVVAPILWLNEKLGSFTYDIFNKGTTNIVDLRLRTPETNIPDLLQTMLDARGKETDSQEGTSDGKPARAMSLQEIGINSTALIIAGFETTSTALSSLTYVLAKYQEIQEMVRSEVASVFEEYGRLDFDAVMQGMKYLSNVVDETLRMYPPGVVFTSRRAENDFEYNGITYKAGTSVMAPTLQVHMDPRYWPEPHKFDPDRFLPENSVARPSIAYQPFGAGPRNCVGLRLALFETMYTAARMVQNYRLTLGNSQKGEMEMIFDATVSAPAECPYIRFQRV
ncbi:cytochrome P450 3A8-like isoform X1 [Haemaphysalis longicornis]